MRSCSIMRISAAGSSSRRITDVHPSYIPAIAQPPPPMWNSGIAMRFTESCVSSHISFAIGSRPKKLSLVSITPFGRPVVPLTSRAGTRRRRCPIRLPDRRQGTDPPSPRTTRSPRGHRSRGSSSPWSGSRRWRRGSGTKSGPTTSTLACASLTMYSTSGAARRQLTSTHTALRSAAPKNTSKCSMPFLSRKATRSCDADTEGRETLGDLGRASVEVSPAETAGVLDECDVVGAIRAVRTQDAGNTGDVVPHGEEP